MKSGCVAALLDQRALVQMQGMAGVLGGLGIVRDHDDGLAVLAVERLQQARISSADLRSRSPVGSSQISRVGSDTIARAIATRCCWPPESSFGLCLPRSSSPTSSSAISALRLRCVRADSLVSSSGSSTFFCAVSTGIRL
jgi:hypothetical protein